MEQAIPANDDAPGYKRCYTEQASANPEEERKKIRRMMEEAVKQKLRVKKYFINFISSDNDKSNFFSKIFRNLT